MNARTPTPGAMSIRRAEAIIAAATWWRQSATRYQATGRACDRSSMLAARAELYELIDGKPLQLDLFDGSVAPAGQGATGIIRAGSATAETCPPSRS